MGGRLRGGASATGSSTVKTKVEPVPGPWLCTRIEPPISSARRWLMARPRPVPPNLRVMLESACEKDWNSRLMPSGDRPMPVSRTQKLSAVRPGAPGSPRTVSTTSPASVNFTALLSRFSRICRTRARSPFTPAGTSPSNT